MVKKIKIKKIEEDKRKREEKKWLPGRKPQFLENSFGEKKMTKEMRKDDNTKVVSGLKRSRCICESTIFSEAGTYRDNVTCILCSFASESVKKL